MSLNPTVKMTEWVETIRMLYIYIPTCNTQHENNRQVAIQRSHDFNHLCT